MKTKAQRTGITRRNLLFTSSALGLTLLLPKRRSTAAPGDAPRFLLNILAPSGLDTSMLFDARPRAMTAAGKIHNPLNEEPMAWVGDNGQTAFTHTTAAPLHPLRSMFSVINGVLMSPSFDGHDQNMNLFLAGNPFGGKSFNAELNRASTTPLDYIRMGNVFANLQDNRTVELTAAGLREMVNGVSDLDAISPSVDDFLRGESSALGDPYDRFGAGVVSLDEATVASKVLSQRLKDIQLGNEADPLEGQLAVIREVFKLGIARGAMFSLVPPEEDFIYDTHASQQATVQGPTYVAILTRLARVFRNLSETPFDATRSLLDVTTVVFASEFGRTMRQSFAPITDTGTDHNPLSNSVLIGGSGIKTGLVVGQSDFQTADEVLSGAHTSLDFESVKLMGKPFDFATQMPRSDKPASFVATDYLQIASVVNTLYSLFEIDRAAWRLADRNGDVAPVLTSLLA